MPGRCYTATFRGDDPEPLIDASLACPVCLHGQAARKLDLEPFDAGAQCTCDRCGTEFAVYLSPEQALRLALTRAPQARTGSPPSRDRQPTAHPGG